ncbi:MAG: hypothetical protein NTZ79_06790 [Proteobacteria bacterium]|nr:hypothetical protein [Pseudomonadota bacterium]
MELHTPFPVLNRFITSGGTIDVGRIDRVDCAAVATDANTLWVALTRRNQEGLMDLLARLNDTLDRCLANGEQVDELDRSAYLDEPPPCLDEDASLRLLAG